MREIKFRAFFQIEDGEHSFSAMIPNVCVYGSQSLGCSFDDFAEAIKPTGWVFDSYDEYFSKDGNLINFGNANVSVLDYEWVTFDGIPMQFTGLHDKSGVEIFQDDIVRAKEYLVRRRWPMHAEEGIETRNVGWVVTFQDYAWRLKYFRTDDAWFPRENLYFHQIVRVEVDGEVKHFEASVPRHGAAGDRDYIKYTDFEVIGNVFENPDLLPAADG